MELGHLDDPVSIQFPDDHRNVVRTREGRWIVVSVGMPSPLMYAADGPFESTVGRVGEGPGEFLDPDRIAIDRTDSIWISDPGGRIVILDPSGVPARTLRSPGYVIDGFTPSNEPYSVLVRLLEVHRDGAPPEVRGVFPYVMVRSRDLDPGRGLGPGLDDPEGDGRTVKMTPWGTIFAADSIVLTRSVQDRAESWIDRWTSRGPDVWLTQSDVGRALGHDEDPLSRVDGSFINLALASDGEGGFWNLAAVRRSASHEEEETSWPNLELEDRSRVFAVYLLHLSADGRITGVVEIPEADPHFVDREHLVSPWVDRDTGLITLRIWRLRRDCGLDRLR